MKYLLPVAALLLSGCAANITPLGAPQSAQEALRPYYATLDAKLPKATPSSHLSTDTVITRFAFGSCVNENRDMKFWDVIAAQKPQAFLLIGDNVYGDTRPTNSADIPTLAASYKKLNSRVEFDRFRRSIPMMTTWDDHDYGSDNSDGSFKQKKSSLNVFQQFWPNPKNGIFNYYTLFSFSSL